ncbi:hypothetical protein ABE83_17195 [Streptomyces sp. CFMR 7]|nr:hypothetical protein ABE83_17195 [Streptomyces sp. CFMR 7]
MEQFKAGSCVHSYGESGVRVGHMAAQLRRRLHDIVDHDCLDVRLFQLLVGGESCVSADDAHICMRDKYRFG